MAGVSHNYLRILELSKDPRTGKPSRPSVDVLKRLARAYNYPYEKLLKAAGYLQTLSDNSKEECDPDIIAIQTAIRKANSQQRKKILELLKATFFELFEDEGY